MSIVTRQSGTWYLLRRDHTYTDRARRVWYRSSVRFFALVQWLAALLLLNSVARRIEQGRMAINRPSTAAAAVGWNGRLAVSSGVCVCVFTLTRSFYPSTADVYIPVRFE